VTVELRRAYADEAGLVESLLDPYLREVSAHREIEVGSTSAAENPYLPLYWSEPGRFAFTIRRGAEVVGFALVRGPESTGSGRFQVAEFYVEPFHRRRGAGREAVAALWRLFPGEWELQVHLLNAAGVRFWRSCIAAAGALNVETREIEAGDGRRFEFTFSVHAG
jgi:predicted acetyltransferase